MKTIVVALAAALAAAPSFATISFDSECSDGFYEASIQKVTTPLCPRWPWEERYGPEMDDPTVFVTDSEGKNFSFLSFSTTDWGVSIRSSKGGHLWTDLDDWFAAGNNTDDSPWAKYLT